MYDAKPEEYASKDEVRAENERREAARNVFNAALAGGAHLRAARRAGDRMYRKMGGKG